MYFYYEIEIINDFTDNGPEICKGILKAKGVSFTAATKILDKSYGDEIQKIILLKPICDIDVLELTSESVAKYMKQFEDF